MCIYMYMFPYYIDTIIVHRYNTGTKSFQVVLAYSFPLSTDALTIQDHYWTTNHKKVSLQL